MSYFYRIQGIVIMTTGGSLIFSKYYTDACTPPTSRRLAPREVQRDLNASLYSRYTASQPSFAHLIEVKNHLAAYETEEDLLFFVIGDEGENINFLSQVLLGLLHSLRSLLGEAGEETFDSRMLEEKYELLLLAVDEFIDNGLVAEDSYVKVIQAVEEVNVAAIDLPGREALTKLNQLIQNSL